jgi:hypothetical protein
VIVRALAEERFGVSVADSKNQRTFVLNQTIKQIYATFLFFKKKEKEKKVYATFISKKFQSYTYNFNNAQYFVGQNLLLTFFCMDSLS